MGADVEARAEGTKRDASLELRTARIDDFSIATRGADPDIAGLNAILCAFQRDQSGTRSEQLEDDQLHLAFEEPMPPWSGAG